MITRLIVAVGVLLLMYAGYLAWKRPPRRLGRSQLTSLGIRGPSIVQFVTAACGPCKAAAPRLREAARQADVPFEQIDVGERPEVARAYGIRSMPTIAVTGASGRVLGVWTDVPPGGELTAAARRARATTTAG